MKSYKLVSKESIQDLDVLDTPNSTRLGLSVVIATFNEEGSLPELVTEIISVLKQTELRSNYEIIVVDDDSKDRTPMIIDSFAKSRQFLAIHRYGEKNLFSAIKDGILMASYSKVLTMDADLSHPPTLIPKMLLASEEHQIVSGSRFIKGGGMEGPILLVLGTRFLNEICRIILGLSVKDLGGNFHLFEKSDFQKIDFKFKATFGEFSFEIFYRAKELDLSVKEIPYVYEFREEGESKKTHVLSTALNYLKRAFQLRFPDPY